MMGNNFETSLNLPVDSFDDRHSLLGAAKFHCQKRAISVYLYVITAQTKQQSNKQ